MREQDKILSLRVSALPNGFLLVCFFSESIWYVGGWSVSYFGSACFVTDCIVTFLLYTEAGTRTNCSQSRQMTNDGRCNDCFSCNPSSDGRTFLRCVQVVLFSGCNQTSSWNSTTWSLFMDCKFPLSKFTMHSHGKRMNSFRQDWRKWIWHLRESNWNTWRVDRFCVFIVRSP